MATPEPSRILIQRDSGEALIEHAIDLAVVVDRGSGRPRGLPGRAWRGDGHASGVARHRDAARRIAIGMLDQLSHIDLTSVSQQSREQADRAVAALVERLNGNRAEASSSVLQPRLIVRGTTGPPPDTGVS
ncbi:substrate-binding domain-containing protein [Mycobacterium sp. RTGN4]|uniref:substrate-binding domain-containing protein n=2 Tax=unclassified Mycobacterium TaxID=2642494 RepID=UPI0029C6AC73|nr:substrate-binding domain-containing protein [Mycobacterium sp. RTGN4]